MANSLIIPLAASQISQSVTESYQRLIDSVSGPLTACAAATSGFLIQNGNKQYGLFIGNTYNTFANNNIKFDYSNSDTCFCLYSNRNFIITGNGSQLMFNNEGSLSIGSGLNTNYKGFQVNTPNPSLILIDTNDTQNQAIRFFKKVGTETFYICRNSDIALDFYSCDSLRFYTALSATPSIQISGSRLAVNSNINNSFEFALSGKSFFSDYSYHSGCVNFSGINCFGHPNSLETGLRVNTISNFNKNSIFNEDISISGLNKNLLIQSGYICAATGYLNNLTGNSINYKTGSFSALCIPYQAGNCAEFDTCVKFKRSIDFLKDIQTSGFISGSVITGSNIQTSGFLKVGSSLCIVPDANQTVDHTICGRCITICVTGNNCSIQLNSNCVFFKGNFEAANAIVSNVNSTGNSINYIKANICNSGNLFVQSGMCFGGSFWLTGGNACFTTQLCTPIVCTNCINQYSTDTNILNCFSNNINVGSLCNGVVNSLTTARAWGVFSLKSGIPALLTGYNVQRISIPPTGLLAPKITGITTTTNITQPYMMYGVVLCSPLKYPFVFNGNFTPIGLFNTGSMNAALGNIICPYGSNYQFTPSQINITPYAGTVPNGGSLPNHFSSLACSISVYEPTFNITATAGGANVNTYSFGNSILAGTGSFVIFSHNN